MKKRYIFITLLMIFVLWLAFVAITVAIVYEIADAAGITDAGELCWSLFPMSLFVLAIAEAAGFFASYFESDDLARKMENMAKSATLSRKVQAPYTEMQPLADVLNKRNADMSKKIAELSEEKDLVEKAQRSKNDFVANITHEMNTPLTAIRGYAELMASGVMDETQTKEAAEILVKQSDRLSKLVTRIINYNELDNDDLPSYELDATQVLNELLEGLAPDMAKKGIVLQADVEESIIVKSRHERVDELFGNLLRNAIRYNRQEGVLTVSLKRTQKGARFVVADTGVGIAEENLERIFERFFTVDKSHSGKGGGFGLGLAMVKKICRRAGWVINVKSVLNEGTTFTVDLIEK